MSSGDTQLTQVELLADHVDLVGELAGWFHEEWPDASVRYDPAARFTQGCNRDRIPMTLVAIERGRAIGTASLFPQSVSSHRHLAPWLAGLYVRPDARHRGIATQLIAAVRERARELGFETIHVGISAARPFYERLGWQYLGEGTADDDSVMVLRCHTAA